MRPHVGAPGLLLGMLTCCICSGLRAEQFNLVIRSEVHGADSLMAFSPLAKYLSDASGHQLTLRVPDSALEHWQTMGKRGDDHLGLDEGHFSDYRVRNLGYKVLAKISGVSGFSVVTGPATVVVEPDELLPHTYAYAKKMAAEVSPASLRETKRQIYSDLHRDVGTAVREADDLLERMMKTDDYGEAVAAYTEKRPPRWSGR